MGNHFNFLKLSPHKYSIIAYVGCSSSSNIIIIVFLLFSGHVPFGLICHPDREHLIYPLGCTVIIQSINTPGQDFLHGHTNNVSCVTVSPSGSYVASGQITFMGFKVDKRSGYSKRRCCLGCHFTKVKLNIWHFLQMIFT
uniref:Uncharacterized protein n=1 Tax=Pseudonaja textilis TaxID=8673 RepID=A0A670YP80_PSETE